MKKHKYYIFIISFNLNAQTSLDSLMFNKINNYRESKGLFNIIWSDSVYKMSNHHSKYLMIINQDSTKSIITHTEEIDAINF